MKIGDEVYVHGFIDEIRNDVIIIRNDGGYFGTVTSEVIEKEETLQNLTKPNKSDLIVKGAGEIKDGLYNIKDGKLFKYKANGGTVRTYPIIEAGWIPCSERLPEENEPVLVGIRYKDDFKMVVTARMDVTYWQGLGRDIKGEMRWMPLPEPYKESEE